MSNTPQVVEMDDEDCLLDRPSQSDDENVDAKSKKYKLDTCHLTIFMCVMALSGMNVTYQKDTTNQLSDTLDARFGWETKDEKAIHNQLITSSFVLGLSVGAGVAGKLIQSGRRRTHLMCVVLGTFGCLLSMYNNFYTLLIARLIQGL